MDTLRAWSDSRAPVDRLFAARSDKLPARDRALAMELVYGVLRHKEHLDRLIGLLSRQPLRKMRPRTRMALRIGLYQLQFCERIPPAAAVNETVSVLTQCRQPRWLTGFVNAVLRRAAGELASLPDPSQPHPDGRPLLNHPQWLLQRWQKRFGTKQATAICQVNNQRPELTLCCNSRKIERKNLVSRLCHRGIRARPGDLSPEAVLLEGDAGAVPFLPGYAKGLFHVQDQAAQLACHLVPRQVGPCLDACAGVGGKTMLLATLLAANVPLTAIEPDQHRFALLRNNLERLELTARVTVHCQTLAEHARSTATRYQAIFVDAPCSGTGVIRRQPDIRWNRTPEDLHRNQEVQTALLQEAASLLLPGGYLVYATCSLESEENEGVVDRFLEDHPGFSLLPCKKQLPPAARHLTDDRGLFTPLPSVTTDGFFAALLQRTPCL